VVRAFLPKPPMSRLSASTARWQGSIVSTMRACSLARCPTARKHYQLRAKFGNDVVEFEDAYRFPPILNRFRPLSARRRYPSAPYDKLGAHPMTLDGVDGIGFVVLAPNARRVAVVGDFNFWNARRHAMRGARAGYWNCSSRTPRPATTTSSTSSGRTAISCR